MKLVIDAPSTYKTSYIDAAAVVPRLGEYVTCTPYPVLGLSSTFMRVELIVVRVVYDYDEETVYVTVQ